MQDFTCTNPDDMNYPVLAQRVRYFKEDTKGVATMCRAFEEVREEGKREQAVEFARRCWQMVCRMKSWQSIRSLC